MDLKSAEETILLAPTKSPSGRRGEQGSIIGDSASCCSSNDTGFASGEDEFEIDSERSLVGESYDEYTDASCADPSVDSSHFSAPNSVVSFDCCDPNLVCDHSEEIGVDMDSTIEPSFVEKEIESSFVEKETFFGDNLSVVDGNLCFQAGGHAPIERHVICDAILREHDCDNLESEDHEAILEKMDDKTYSEEVEYNGAEITNGFLRGDIGDKSILTEVSGNSQLNGIYPVCVNEVSAGLLDSNANGVEEFEMKDEFMVMAELLESVADAEKEKEDTNVITKKKLAPVLKPDASSTSDEQPLLELDNGYNVDQATEKCLVFAPGTDGTILWDPLGLNVFNSSVKVPPSYVIEQKDMADTVTVTSKVQSGANSTLDEQMVENIDNGFITGETVEHCSVSDVSAVTLNANSNGEHVSNLKDAIPDSSNLNEIEGCAGEGTGSEIVLGGSLGNGGLYSQMNGDKLDSQDSIEVNSCQPEKLVESEPDFGVKMVSESGSTHATNIVTEDVTENRNGGLGMDALPTWRNEHDNSSCGGSIGRDEREGSISDSEIDGMVFGSSEAANAFFEEFGQEINHSEHTQLADGQIVSESDEEDGDEVEMFDSDALAAILKVANGSGSDGNTFILTSKDGSKLFSLQQPSLGSTPLTNQPHNSKTEIETSENVLSEEVKGQLESLHRLKVKYLKLVKKLGYSPEEPVAQQVLYRLALTGQYLSPDYAKWKPEEIESDPDSDADLDISLNILVIGKTGVGKSATVNSIFGESRVSTNAFEPSTIRVKEITGKVEGISIRVFDTPGLRASPFEHGFNNKVLSAIKKSMKNHTPDVILYIDRMDTQFRYLNDLPLLRSINSFLGVSIWKTAIVTLTHAASEPPEGPSGSPISYETFVSQRSRIAQQTIAQGIGNFNLMNVGLLNQVALVENHSCPKNRDGQKVLPNGQTWRTYLLLRCCSMKILSDLGAVSNTKDQLESRKMFNFRPRSPNLPYLLSWLLQPHSHPKFSAGEDGGGDIDADMCDMEEEGEDEYDQLPPFTPLRKSQIEMLSKEQRKAYFDEYDYRVKLFQTRQWKEEVKRMHEVKKSDEVTTGSGDDSTYMGEYADPTPATVPVALPDLVLPLSFDGDNPAYRYRFLEPTGSQFLARPVFDTNGWDHDFGHHGVMVEHNMAVLGMFPASVSAQMTKDKDDFTIHLDSSVSAKHGSSGSSMIGFDIQDIGKRRAYIVRGETKLCSRKMNKMAAGLSATFLGDSMTPGAKLENETLIGKRLALVGSAGTVRSNEDAVYGANLEVRLREADFPVSQDQQHALGFSLVRWRGDLALSSNLVSQFPIGRTSKMAVRLSLNHKRSGQIAIRTNSSEQLQIALFGIIPIAASILKSNMWTKILDMSCFVS